MIMGRFFELSALVIGLPPLVVACCGVLTAAVIALLICLARRLPDSEDDTSRRLMIDKMDKIANSIADGALTFLSREYIPLTIVALILFLVIAVVVHWQTAIWLDTYTTIS